MDLVMAIVLAHSLDLVCISTVPHFMLKTISVKGSIPNVIISLPTFHTTADSALLTSQTQHLPGLPWTMGMGACLLVSYGCCNKSQ